MNITTISTSTLPNSLIQFKQFKHFDYLKLCCDIFFCLVNIYKLFIINS